MPTVSEIVDCMERKGVAFVYAHLVLQLKSLRAEKVSRVHPSDLEDAVAELKGTPVKATHAVQRLERCIGRDF